MRLNFSSRFSVIFVTLATAIALASCGGSEPEETSIEPDDSSVPTVQGEPLDGADKLALEAGSYCYRTEEETVQAIAEFLVEPDQSVTGTLEATVTDDENAYYTSYKQNFAGVLQGETLDASITTYIEDDIQDNQEVWTLNENQLSSDSAILLKRVDCEEIIALKSTQKDQSKPVAAAPATTPSVTPAPAPSPQAAPQAIPQQPKAVSTATSPIRIQFNEGSSETVVKGSLAANQTQVYLINAQEGQDMYLDITNGSGSAIFDVEVDNGEVIQEDLPEYIEFTLPFSGDYIVTVKSQASNTSYALSVTVE